MKRSVPATLLAVSLAASSTFGGDWQPPPVATSWKAYEVAYPKKTVSGAALEIERLAAKLGIDAAPTGPTVIDSEDDEEIVQLRPHDGRDRPDPALEKRMSSRISAVGQWVDHELAEPVEKIGPPPAAVARFFEVNVPELDAIVAVTSGARPIEWDLDVALRSEAPIPNLAGLTRIERVLAGRALLQMRAGDNDSALVTIDGMWRLAASLAEQPYLISQLIAMNQIRLVVGLLRKVDSPAFGWEERLRQRAFYEAFLAAFQNDPWPASQDPRLAPSIETITRIYRRFVDALGDNSPCDWTKDTMAHSWEVATSAEKWPDDMIEISVWDQIVEMAPRWQRLLVDSEMTALVLQARAEKAASREGEWPARLPNLESSVCPGHFYSYRRAGGVTLAFEGRLPVESRQGLVLPVSFRGASPPTPTPTPALTPTPTPHRLASP